VRGRLDIPLRFDTQSPPKLKEQLERQASALDAFVRNLGNLVTGRPSVVPYIYQTGTVGGVLGTQLRIAPRQFEEMTVALPPSVSANGGLVLEIIRGSSVGTAWLTAVGSSVNGFDRVMLLASIGVTRVYFDGVYYFADRFAVPWNQGLL
jgi:hypothetical protein